MKKNKSVCLKVLCAAAVCVLAFVAAGLFAGVKNAYARTITITTPEELIDINWANKGFGPGNTYIIGNDMTLGETDQSTCTLTSGKFIIDFNGHTVQNGMVNNLAVFNIRGAEVLMMDSKASDQKPSVRSYGAGAINMVGGYLEILSGNYCGMSNGTNNPCGLHVGGGTCVVRGGYFYGDTIGADCSGGGTLNIYDGTFQTSFWFGLVDMGNGNIHIKRGTFIGGTTTYNYHFALGALSGTSQTYDFGKWLESGSSFSPQFQTGYWNLQSSVTAMPTISNYYAVAYNTTQLAVGYTGSATDPASTVFTPDVVNASNGTAANNGTGNNASNAATPAVNANGQPNMNLGKVKAGKKQLNVKWKRATGNVSGYELQLATNKKFSKGVKTYNIGKAKTTSKKIKKLKSNKTYYVRIRNYREESSTKFFSDWSKAKKVKVK